MESKLVLSVLAATFVGGASFAAERTIYVAPNNAAVRDGTAAHPFAAPREAQLALRALKTKEPGASWTISLAAGEYLLDEPLVITGLTPGQYEIDLITSCCQEYDVTFTGPISGGCVSIVNSYVPTVITLVARKRFARRRRRCGCSCMPVC